MLTKIMNYFVIFLLFLGGCAGSQALTDNQNIKERLAPGLQVLYFNGMFKNVRQIPDGERLLFEKGRPGEPISIINHQFGVNEVFDSGRNRGVGVQMKGYLHLDQQGRYEFQALSNDGVEVIIDGNTILIDFDVHSDRLSEVGTLSVEESGWRSLMVKYFQRKGTAALTIYWKPPGKDEFEVIPEWAYAHLPNDFK